jgi:hypothetical protein
VGVLSGNVQLSGHSAIGFKRGEITSLAAGAQLQLNGGDAFIEDSTALGRRGYLRAPQPGRGVDDRFARQ